MTEQALHDPILRRYLAALDIMYGARIDKVVLFGSRARNEDRAGSDYDVAVFLKGLSDRWMELDLLADLRLEFLGETGSFFDTMPFPAEAYSDRTP